MQRWEYARFYYRAAKPEFDVATGGRVTFSHGTEGSAWEIARGATWDAIRRLGDDGWELVAANHLPGRRSPDAYEMYFKRALEPGVLRDVPDDAPPEIDKDQESAAATWEDEGGSSASRAPAEREATSRAAGD